MAVLWLWVSPLAVDSRGLQILRPRPLPRTATHSWGLGRGPRWQDFFLSSPSDSKVQPIIELHEIELTRWQLGCGDARQKQDLQTFVTWHWSHTPWEIQIRYVHLYFFFHDKFHQHTCHLIIEKYPTLSDVKHPPEGCTWDPMLFTVATDGCCFCPSLLLRRPLFQESWSSKIWAKR